MGPSGQHYKIKLASGRILGPLDLQQIRKFILKNRIVGTESARSYPEGDWKDINQISEIASLLVARAQGVLENATSIKAEGKTRVELLPGATQVLVDGEAKSFGPLPTLQTLEGSEDVLISKEVHALPKESLMMPKIAPGPAPASVPETEEPTVAITSETVLNGGEDEEKTRVYEPLKKRESSKALSQSEFLPQIRSRVADAPTVLFQRTADFFSKPTDHLPGRGRMTWVDRLRGAFLALVIGALGYQFLLDEPSKPVRIFVPIRPALPVAAEKVNPDLSNKLYLEAMAFYIQDNVAGYKSAAEKLRVSAGLDSGNVKALAMLASSYLNLIDSSNKDENYFSVISTLIEMSRAKNLDLPETVIADVEFYMTANKPEAAQNRIVEYTKTHQKFDPVMFYYISLAFLGRGDAQTASRYISQFPENKAFSPKLFYLRGQIAEKLNEQDTALREYEKGVSLDKNHAKSRLRMAELLGRRGQLKDAALHLDFIVTHQALLAPKDLSRGYFLHSQLNQLYNKFDLALGDMERAVRLDPKNHDYLLELYALRAKAGDKSQEMKTDARMYYFLGEGEKFLKEGKTHEALTQFLIARQSKELSPVPLIKIGDMFSRLHDLGNAKINYGMATKLAPNSIEIWSKYIAVLIESYEWAEATAAMDKFRQLPVPQSAIDKAAADLYAKQGRHLEAQTFYRKAMARDTIDPGVYIAYATSLMATRDFKSAPFFFALALRFDPLNTDAIIGTARCVAATESIDRAISMMQDELQKSVGPKAEFLAAIADFQMQKGDWAQAQENIEQAKAADPGYAYPWKLQALVYMSREGTERGALDKALFAYQSYSDRNASDPSGYLERYRIFMKKSQFEKAEEELTKIYGIYPKYPNWHYYKGILYSTMGNRKAAIQEFQAELVNNSRSVPALISLGREYVQAGSPQDGVEYLNKAMQLAPRSAEPKHEAAWANYVMKNYAGAIALYQAALAFDHANPLLYKRLGLAYRDAGDPRAAAQAFRKYLEMEPDATDKAQFQQYR